MTLTPLMPMATAVWLVENTTLTFKQIANFCNIHEVEVQGIADGEVAKGIVGYNPIISGQLTKEEIELSSKDNSRPLNLTAQDIEISNDVLGKPEVIFLNNAKIQIKKNRKNSKKLRNNFLMNSN